MVETNCRFKQSVLKWVGLQAPLDTLDSASFRSVDLLRLVALSQVRNAHLEVLTQGTSTTSHFLL